MTIPNSSRRKPSKRELENMTFLQILELNNNVIQEVKMKRRFTKVCPSTSSRSLSHRRSSARSCLSSLSSISEDNVENGTNNHRSFEAKNDNEWKNKPSVQVLSSIPPCTPESSPDDGPPPMFPKYALNLESLSNFLSPVSGSSRSPLLLHNTSKRSVSPTLESRYPSLIPNHNSISDGLLGRVVATKKYNTTPSSKPTSSLAKPLQSETNGVVTSPALQKATESERLAAVSAIIHSTTEKRTMKRIVSPDSQCLSFLSDPSSPEQSIGLVAATSSPNLYLSPIKKMMKRSVSPQPGSHRPSVIPDAIDKDISNSLAILPSPTTPSIAKNHQTTTTPDPEVGAAGFGNSRQYGTSRKIKPLPPPRSPSASGSYRTIMPISPDHNIIIPVSPWWTFENEHVSSGLLAAAKNPPLQTACRLENQVVVASGAPSMPLYSSSPVKGTTVQDIAGASCPPSNQKIVSPSEGSLEVRGDTTKMLMEEIIHKARTEEHTEKKQESPGVILNHEPFAKEPKTEAKQEEPVRRDTTTMLMKEIIHKARTEHTGKKQESPGAILNHEPFAKEPKTEEKQEETVRRDTTTMLMEEIIHQARTEEHTEKKQESPGAILNHEPFAKEPKTEEKQEEPFPTVSSASDFPSLFDQNDSMLDSQVDPRGTSPQPLKKTCVDESSPEALSALQVQGDKVVQVCASGYHASGGQLSCEPQNKPHIGDVEDQNMIVEMPKEDNSQQTSFNVTRTHIVVCFFFLLVAGVALAVVLI